MVVFDEEQFVLLKYAFYYYFEITNETKRKFKITNKKGTVKGKIVTEVRINDR